MSLLTGESIRKVFVQAFVALAIGAFCYLTAEPARAADWRQQASPADINRLVQLPSIRMRAINAAQTWQGQGDFNAMRRVLEPEARTVPARAMLGNWRCRQMKLGGMSPYIVYDSWFLCNIRYVNGGLLFQKVTGTQRTIGFLYPEKGSWVYLGASSAKDEPWHNYSGRTPSIGAEVTPDDQIGLLTGIGNNHLRLEIPAIQESLLDVIELAR
jgi:hypothetical protein